MNKRMFVIFVLIFLGCLSFAQQRDSIVRVGACATPGITWGVFVQDSFAYVADRGYLTMIDILIPSAPTVAGTLSQTGVVWPIGIVIQDTIAYLHNNGIFSIVSVSNPGSLYVIGWCFTSSGVGTEPKGISLKGDLVYLAEGSEGFDIINSAVPASPVLIDSFHTNGIAVDLYVKDTLIFIADIDSLQIFNISDSTNAYRAGSVAMPNSCYDVFVVDTFAYVVCQSSFGTDGSIQVVNVSNPASPQIVASVNNLNGDPLDVWISGDYAYVAASDFWVPTTGKERQIGGLRADWTFKKRADVEGGLRVVDISNPLSPALIASYDTPGDPRGIFAVDTLAFIADYDSLQILRHIQTGIRETTKKYMNNINLLLQNKPNPFCNYTTIFYQLSAPGQIRLEVLDIAGRCVNMLYSGYNNAGTYEIIWSGSNQCGKQLANGVYFLCLTTDSHILFSKILLLK